VFCSVCVAPSLLSRREKCCQATSIPVSLSSVPTAFLMIQTKQMTVVRESYPPTPATCRCGSEDQMPLTEPVTKHTTGQNCCTRTEL